MSNPSYHASTTLPIHRPISPIHVAMDNASSSQINNSHPCPNITTTSSVNNHNPNAMDVKPSLNPSQSIITPSATQTCNTTDKTRVRRHSEIFKDWYEMTLAQRLEATTDLPLVPLAEYEWKVENELPCLNPWPSRQRCKT